jgi:hypothetical protein
MQTESNGVPIDNAPHPFDVDLRVLAIGAERTSWLASLIRTVREELRPRDLVERHFVDELAINKWRLLRVYGMEKAVYEHQLAIQRPAPICNPAGRPVEPNRDIYQLAQANAPQNDGAILAALSRLEARFHRQFCAALKMLQSLRRTNPLILIQFEKEPTTCVHCNSSSVPPGTTQPNSSRPDSSPQT